MSKVIIGSVIMGLALISTSCVTKNKASVDQNVDKSEQAQQVEKLQNSSEYSAVESEWNEMYQ